MALTATIIAFAGGLAAKVKVKPPRDVDLRRDLRDLKAENAQLRHAIEMLDRELATERSLKLHWRDEASRLAVEMRLRREAQERHAQQAAHILQAQQMQAQAQLAYQQLGQYQQQALGAQNLLGAQNIAMPEGWTCTCIPDRASALRRDEE
jgi:hypothetical protein